MQTAPQLLRTYLAGIQTPAAAASLFANDGVLELPWIHVRAQGPEAIEALIAGLLKKVPAFGFKNSFNIFENNPVWSHNANDPDKLFKKPISWIF